jgi:hypothetical protein
MRTVAFAGFHQLVNTKLKVTSKELANVIRHGLNVDEVLTRELNLLG